MSAQKFLRLLSVFAVIGGVLILWGYNRAIENSSLPSWGLWLLLAASLLIPVGVFGYGAANKLENRDIDEKDAATPEPDKSHTEDTPPPPVFYMDVRERKRFSTFGLIFLLLGSLMMMVGFCMMFGVFGLPSESVVQVSWLAIIFGGTALFVAFLSREKVPELSEGGTAATPSQEQAAVEPAEEPRASTIDKDAISEPPQAARKRKPSPAVVRFLISLGFISVSLGFCMRNNAYRYAGGMMPMDDLFNELGGCIIGGGVLLLLPALIWGFSRPKQEDL